MWANLLNISSRSGAGGRLTPRDMRDEANNFVMGLLFLSGDGWEGSGGQGPGPRRGMQARNWGQAAVVEGTQASSVVGAEWSKQVLEPLGGPSGGRPMTTTRQQASCPSSSGACSLVSQSQSTSS